MYLKLKNIGKITEAYIELKGMTVIAGENNTGKSTVSRALFSSFNSLYKYEEEIYNTRYQTVTRAISRFVNNEYSLIEQNFQFNELINDNLKEYINLIILNPEEENFNKQFQGIYELIIRGMTEYDLSENSENDENSDNIKDLQLSIGDALKISNQDIHNRLTTNIFRNEFDDQVNNLYVDGDAKIELVIKNDPTIFSVEKNAVKYIENPKVLKTQAVYIDDPFVLDDKTNFWFMSRKNDHRSTLKRRLLEDSKSDTIEQIVVDKKIDKIFEKLNSVVNGELISDGRRNISYRPKEREESIRMSNISSGLKTFIIIKELLQNGTLEKNGTLILDEPEIHLHPEWQILLAELIVLIQKEFGMHILLTTHSPYFLYAVEVFTARYDLKEQCNYYIAENIMNDVVFRNVSGSIDEIYKKLSDPFQKLENLSYE